MKNKKLIISILVLVCVITPVLFILFRGDKVAKFATNVKNTVTGNQGIAKIKHIGFEFDYYDPKTQTAGELEFTKKPLGEFKRPYFDYGYKIPANSAGNDKVNPQPTFILPLGTKVKSLVDGVVVNVSKLYSNDYSVHVAADKNSNIVFETEHIINVTVKVGDVVKAGDVVGEVSDYDAHNYSGYGLYEIGILKGGNPPEHVCPFAYLDESIKEDTYAKLRSFYKAWNEYIGEKIYDENIAVPGCISIEGIKD